MLPTLSTGCLADIIAGADLTKPVLQILGTKRINPGVEPERYRLLVSDGKYVHSYAMLATQLNDLVNKNELDEFTVIVVNRYITSVVNRSEKVDRRVLIILELSVSHPASVVKQKIGNPMPLNDDGSISSTSSSSSNVQKPQMSTTNNGNTSSNIPKPSTFNNNSMNNSSASDSLNNRLTHPICGLTPYQNKWVIKARVTSKSSIRSWSNAKGEGKLFSMDLMDESGEIRATAFKEQCDKYYDMIEVDKVYFITKCTLKPANKQYTTIKNDYEMTFNNDTMVQECLDISNIPAVIYNFVPISQIANMETNSIIDILGVCRDVSDIQKFTAKSSGRELQKREITLVDTSNTSIQVTLWGDEAVNFDGISQPIILLKNARVSEFGGGKTLGLSSGSTMKINPDITEGHKLRGWFDNGGGESITNSLSTRSTLGGNFNTEWLSFREAKDKNLGSGDKPDYFQCKAVVHIVKSSNAAYKACPQPECNKKVIDQENGQYRCEKCNNDYSNFKYRLLINMSIGDWTSNRWVTCFNEVGEQLLGKTSQEVGEALENNLDQVQTIFSSINFKSFIFKLRTKNESYGDSNRNKITVITAAPVNYKEYNAYLIKNLQEITGIGKTQ